MHTALYNAARFALATMAFATVFILTPRAWVQQADAPSTQNVTVRTLEDSDTCLWCTPVPRDDEPCRGVESNEPRAWDEVRSDEDADCASTMSDEARGPNA
jgi:hypothetical protein